MPKLTIKRNDTTMEISDLSLDEIKELAGLNGHAQRTHGRSAPRQRGALGASLGIADGEADYKAFYRAIGDRGRKFFATIGQNPHGVSGEGLAEKLGFSSPVQIGGLAGASLAKWAKEFNVRLSKLYVKERHKLDTGEWRTTYRPGPEIGKLQ